MQDSQSAQPLKKKKKSPKNPQNLLKSLVKKWAKKLILPCISLPYCIHRITAWVGWKRTLKLIQLIPTMGRGTSHHIPGCSKLHPTRPWTLPEVFPQKLKVKIPCKFLGERLGGLKFRKGNWTPHSLRDLRGSGQLLLSPLHQDGSLC